MQKQTPAISVLFKGIPSKAWVVLFVLLCLVSAYVPLASTKTQAATSSTINFQARLLQANGAVVADGYYNVEFKLYDVSSGGSALWTETRYDSNGVTAGNDNRVRVANGYVTVNLGSVAAFPSINWDQELWLTMNIGGTSQTASPTWDGEMNPRLKFTASPYAFAAGKLQTSSGANTSTLGFASQTASRNLLLPDESGTLCIQSSSNCGFAAASGSSSYIQNGTSSQAANFNISGFATIGSSLTVQQGIFINNTAGISRAAITQTGVLEFGDGTNTRDVNLYRLNANVLATDDRFLINAGSGTVGLSVRTTADVNDRFAVGANGALSWGTGSAIPDVNLYRSAADTLKTDDALTVGGALSVTSTADSYIMGALGLGTASPQTGSALTIANASWISSVDGAGTGYVNLFQVNSNNEIQVGAALNVDGGIILPTNGGQLTLVDLPMDSTSTAGTVHGYSLRVGTTNALTVYGQSDGAGGAQNVRVAIGSSITPGYVLDVSGDTNISSGSSYRINGTAICTSSGCTPASGSANYIQNGTGQQASSNFNISGAGVVGTTLAVNGNTLSTTSTTMSLFNTGATTLNIGGAATALNIGASSGTASFNGRLNIGGSVSARLAVTATNNNEPTLYVRTTNAANYGNALQITNGTTNYMTIGAYGAVTFNLATAANVAQAYRFNTGSDGAGIILDMNAQQQSVGIAKAASATHKLDVNGSMNASSLFVGGVAISSANLSDYSSLARLNTTNTLTSSSAFIVTNGTTNGIIVDTSNNRVGIGTNGAPGNYTLDVGGKFMVDKPNNRVIVGTWGGDTSGTLTVLGNKTNTGDPTGVAGAMYYSSFHGSFRCYTNSLWQDCGPQTKKVVSIDGTQGSSFYSVEDLRFTIRPDTDYAIKCSLLYQSSLASSGAIFSLGGDGTPSSLAGMVSTFSTSTSTPAGYMFSAFDSGVGTSDAPGAFTDTPATLDATYTSGSGATTLVLRLKPEVSSEILALYPGSYCQLTRM